MVKLSYRDFRPEDRTSFLSMCRDFFSGDAVSHSIPESFMESTFQQIMTGSPYLRGLIMELDGETAGYCQLSFTWSNEAGGMVVWIEELYVRPEFQHMGLGGGCLDYIRSSYPDAKRFRLEVCENNLDAKRLYQKKEYQYLDYQQMFAGR